MILICGVTTTVRRTTRLHTNGTDLDPVSAPVTLSLALPSLAPFRERATCHYLTDHIICYENASLHMTHSSGQGQEIKISFTAFSRRFDLILQRIEPSTLTTVLSSHKLNITIIGLHTQSRQTVDIAQYYTGRLLGEHSRFFGHLQNGVLYGEIYTATETYFVEPFERYFRSAEANNLKVVIYRERDIMQLTHSLSTHYKSIATGHQHENLSIFYHKEEPMHFQRHRPKRHPAQTGHKACALKIIVDYNFYKYYCDGSVMKTVNEVVYAVTTASTIFRTMDFDSDGKPDIIGFTIKEIVLHEHNSSWFYLSESEDPLQVLSTFTKYDLSDYCLGVLFTYHELKDGVLGLAWRASSSMHGRPGGICGSLGAIRSLNSLIVTADCYGSPVPRWLLALSLTHELGHSFGSQHDNSSNAECFPDSYSGNYIMSDHITYRLKPNNKKFSKCSLLQMSPVVFYKSHCFETLSVASLCGNYMLDPGEGCDCGPVPDQCHFVDPCCVPPTAGQSGCRVATELGKNCSARASACCSQDCQVETRSTICRNATECTEAAFCNGVDFDCPETVPRPDGTLCMGGMRVCVQGDCIMSTCRRYDWEDCECLGKTSEFCQLCCRNISSTRRDCVPVYAMSHTDHLLEPVYKPFGEMCGNDGGYCNNEHVCVTGYTRACAEIMEHAFNFTSNEVFINWLLNHWFLVLAAVSSAALCFAMLHVYTSSLNNFSLTPYMTGKEIALKENIRTENVSLADQLLDLESSYQWKLSNLTKGSTITMVMGVTRLYYLFPTVPNAVLTEVINSSSCEELAVRWLLLKGYPMRKLPPQLPKC